MSRSKLPRNIAWPGGPRARRSRRRRSEPDVPVCGSCGEPKQEMRLLADDSVDDTDLKPFWFCRNRNCDRGPRVIRSLA